MDKSPYPLVRSNSQHITALDSLEGARKLNGEKGSNRALPAAKKIDANDDLARAHQQTVSPGQQAHRTRRL